MPWVTEIRCVREWESFVDEQRFGPYKFWHHLHSFEEKDGGVLMKDIVYYALPLWPFGEMGHDIFVRPKLERIFGFRKEILAKRFSGSSPQKPRISAPSVPRPLPVASNDP